MKLVFLYFLFSLIGITLFAASPCIPENIFRNISSAQKGSSTDGIDRNTFAAATLNIGIGAPVSESEIKSDDLSSRIMEEVIHRKQILLGRLNRWSAIVCTKAIVENDTSIVSFREQVSDLLWDHNGGFYSRLKYQHNSDNFPSESFEEGIARPVNLFDDEIVLDGFKFTGPASPKAFKIYEFRIRGQRGTEHGREIEIAFLPKNKRQPAIYGSITIIDSVFAVKNIRLATNRPLRLSVPIISQENHIRWIPPQDREISLLLEQNFIDYEGCRFPEDLNVAVFEKIWSPGLNIPVIRYNVKTRFIQGFLTPLQINGHSPGKSIPAPITGCGKYYEEDNDQYFRNLLSEAFPSIEKLQQNPLIDSPDSSMTLEDAFRTTGFLTRFGKVTFSNGEWRRHKIEWKRLTPLAEYNRVDGLRTGLSFTEENDRMKVGIEGSYLQGQSRWVAGGDAEYRWGGQRNVRLSFSWMNGSEPISPVLNHSLYANSLRILQGRTDYYNYFWNDRRNVTFGYRFPNFPFGVSAGMNNERHTSLGKSSNEIFLNTLKKQPENPAVDDGVLRSLVMTLTLGDKPPSRYSASSPWIEFNLEHTDPSLLGGDFSFTRLSGSFALRYTTFFRNEYTPNTLDLHFLGGISTGNLPVQRFGIVGNRSTGYLFRTFGGRTLEGEQYFALAMQHNFGSVPFEHLGWRFFSDNGSELSLHGAIGRSWVAKERLPQLPFIQNYSRRLHSEFGVSLDRLFRYCRLDLTKQLDGNEVDFDFSWQRHR
jgi:hypothetical protein